MFDIVRYTADKEAEWNAFVAQSKNGTFLFDRGYMDYHSDRFTDHSLMFFERVGCVPYYQLMMMVREHCGRIVVLPMVDY